jgi:hypothetical protein
MPSDRKPSLILLRVLAALLVYVVVYCAMVVRGAGDMRGSHPMYVLGTRRLVLTSAVNPIFAPLHWGDRHIRPNYWGSQPTREEWGWQDSDPSDSERQK